MNENNFKLILGSSKNISSISSVGRKKTVTNPGDIKKLALANASVETQMTPIQNEDKVWGPKCLAQASLPYRNPKPEQLENGCWIRRNGNYTLWAQGGPKGLPYGSYPRVFMFWLTSEVLRTGNRRIETGGSFAEFCRKVQIDTSRGKNGAGRRFAEQVYRTLDTRFVFIKGQLDNNPEEIKRLQVAEENTFFFMSDKPGETSLFTTEIVLSDSFFKEIRTHSIPLDLRAVTALKQSPLELDIYQWLAYRMYSLKSPAFPTWDQLRQQFGSGHGRMVEFRRDFLKALQAVKQVYPGAKVGKTDTGLILSPSLTPVPKKF